MIDVAEKHVIQVDHLKKYFPVEKGFLEKLFTRTRRYVRAVDDVSFSIDKGEVFTLAGESGCGKTTTGRLVVGLLPPTSGKIFFEGTNIATLDPENIRLLRRKIQIVFQDPYASFSPRMTIGDAIGHSLSIFGLADSRSDRRKSVLKMLEKVGLAPAEQFIDVYPHQLSGGQRQRAAIARSLILGPDFVVADEPVSMIDVSIRTTIIDLLLSLRKEFGLTYLFITHDLAVAKYISDRLAIMYLGKIIEIGGKDEVFANPLHPYTKALLSAIPVPDPERRRRGAELKGEVPSAIDIPAGCRFRSRCESAGKSCAGKEPELVEVEHNHFVACHVAYEEAS
jgi:oligopeptide/dipeptide ABC transporter ATP-binding protein